MSHTIETPPNVIGMPALTICQPYADLVLLPDGHPAHKRAENRKWYSPFRGRLLIHAGKSRGWIREDAARPGYDVYGLKVADLTFGAIVGDVDMVACFAARDILAGRVPAEFRWLKDHRHVEGPFCHVYRDPRRFARPIPCRGALGHFVVTAKHLPAPAAAAAPPPASVEVPGVPTSLFDTAPSGRWS